MGERISRFEEVPVTPYIKDLSIYERAMEYMHAYDSEPEIENEVQFIWYLDL